MFESKTYESILNDMLDTVPDDIDIREGSLVYNAIAPAAMELKQMYINLDLILKETFADTASREYLIKRAYERGITPKAATKAVLKGVFDVDIDIGSRFSLGTLRYVAIEKITTNEYKMECETAGTIGNGELGRIVPIEYIQGLTSANLTAILTPGEDEESTESLRQRYINGLFTESFGGNQEDYRVKTNALNGVGGTKVYPAWNGGGTVKLEIIDSDFNVPSAALTDEVQESIDPVSNAGEGIGIAPIGHVVTVVGVTEESINIELTITYESGYTFASIQSHVENMIDAYFLEIRQTWETSNSLVVRISQIVDRMLDISGVIDVTNTLINGVGTNYTVTGIPKRGNVSG